MFDPPPLLFSFGHAYPAALADLLQRPFDIDAFPTQKHRGYQTRSAYTLSAMNHDILSRAEIRFNISQRRFGSRFRLRY